MPIPTLLIRGSLQYPKPSKGAEAPIPIEFIIQFIKNKLGKKGIENKILLLRSETASGKSTAIPAEIYINILSQHRSTHPGIICTQPRIITSIRNVAEIVYNAGPSYPNYLKIGTTIGWVTQHNKLKPTQINALTSATVGTLAMQLKTMTDEDIMNLYQFIILDEIHERDLQIDMTLYLLKKFLVRCADNPKCPMVILMSATFDAEPFAKYFNTTLEKSYIYVSGASQGHKEIWDWNGDRTVGRYPLAAADVVNIICTKDGVNDTIDEADILIFLPGASEFSETISALVKVQKSYIEKKLPVFTILPIDSETQKKESKAYRSLDIPLENLKVNKTLKPNRRVILSTNIAETGLTLPNLKYVIDSGYNREIEYNPVYGVRALLTKPCPESRRNQRRGRAGRKFPGVFYPLYPKYIQEKMQKQQLPQILTEDISLIMLDIISASCGVATDYKTADDIDIGFGGESGSKIAPFRIDMIDMIDVPSPDSISMSLEKLFALGFIEFAPNASKGHIITKLGFLALRFNLLSPEIIRMILSSWYWRCDPRDIITIAAYLLIKPNFLKLKPTNPINWKMIYKEGVTGVKFGTPHFSGDDIPHILYRTQLIIADGFIEGIILFNAISKVLPGDIKKWCISMNLKYENVLMFLKQRDGIIDQCIMAGLDIFIVANRDNPVSLATINEENFADYIARLKYCIYDGFRLNMARLGDDGLYRSSRGLVIKYKGLWDDTLINTKEREKNKTIVTSKPKFIIYDELFMKFNIKRKIFDVNCERVSALDGYVAFDENFCG